MLSLRYGHASHARCAFSAAASNRSQDWICKFSASYWSHAPVMCASLSISASSAAKSDRLIVAFSIAIVASSMLFWVFPEVDLIVSRWFFSPDEGFLFSSDPNLQWLRKSSPWALAGVITFILVRILGDAMNGALTLSRARKPIWLLFGLAFGPGLIVNGILKEFWGRPRPVNLDIFGGDAVHQMVWVISDWCDGNCSFVSGEASSSAWLVAAALVTPKKVRPYATAITLIYAVSLSLNRIAFGGHFLSDVVLAWFICGLIFSILYRLTLETAYPFCSDRSNAKQRRVEGRAGLEEFANSASTYQAHARNQKTIRKSNALSSRDVP